MCAQQWRPLHIHTRMCALVYVCVCVRQRRGARERLCGCLCLCIFAWFRVLCVCNQECVCVCSGTNVDRDATLIKNGQNLVEALSTWLITEAQPVSSS